MDEYIIYKSRRDDLSYVELHIKIITPTCCNSGDKRLNFSLKSLIFILSFQNQNVKNDYQKQKLSLSSLLS